MQVELQVEGRVVREQSGFFWVEIEDGRIITCRLRGRLKEEAQASDIAAIGDCVKITILEDGSGTINEVEERRNALSRSVRTEGVRGAGGPEREHVLIANVGQALFVFAAAQPAPSPKLIDRFLVSGEKAGIEPLIIVANKIDLDEDGTGRERFRVYEDIGYRVLYTSARDKTGVEDLRDVLSDKVSVFTGPSGVGKTSLLNTVQPGLGRTVKSISRFSQEGIHTTRDSELVKLDQGGYLADTPGIRQLAIWDVEPEELDAYYREIAPLVSECWFRDCTHSNEPGCAVRAAVEAGTVSRARYESYLSLRAELEAAYAID